MPRRERRQDVIAEKPLGTGSEDTGTLATRWLSPSRRKFGRGFATFEDGHRITLVIESITESHRSGSDRAWTFRTVGFGHGEPKWREIVSALRVAGYDDVISIEHEDILPIPKLLIHLHRAQDAIE